MSLITRRRFLSTSTGALAGLSFQPVPGFSQILPLRSSRPVSDYLPDLIDPNVMRDFAVNAMEVAEKAGATYADIRVANRRMMFIGMDRPASPFGSIGFDYSYGARVLVDGVWASGYGSDPRPAGVTSTIIRIVKTARQLAKLGVPKTDLIPVPVVMGQWRTPVKIDPFGISPDEHAFMLSAYMNAATRAKDSGGVMLFHWTSETRVFASTEGSLTTQYLAAARPQLVVKSFPPLAMDTNLTVSQLTPTSAGFEITTGPELQDKVKETAEDAQRLSSFPVVLADVGRYDAVLDGFSLGAVAGSTLLPALEMERVIGLNSDAAGTSFLSPHEDILGQQLFSQALTISSDRSIPSFGSAKWDDEGVVTAPFSLIDKGRIVDYLTTRSTGSYLKNWSSINGRNVQLHGTAFSWSPTRAPIGSAAYMGLGCSTQGETLDDMTHRIDNGFLIRNVEWVAADQQLSGGYFNPDIILEIKRGKITRRIRGASIQIGTKAFWKSIVSMGDASTVQSYTRNIVGGTPWTASSHVISAPAAYVMGLNVSNMGGRR